MFVWKIESSKVVLIAKALEPAIPCSKLKILDTSSHRYILRGHDWYHWD